MFRLARFRRAHCFNATGLDTVVSAGLNHPIIKIESVFVDCLAIATYKLRDRPRCHSVRTYESLVEVLE